MLFRSLWFITANTMGHSAFRAKRSPQASFFRLKLWSDGCKTSPKILRQDSSSAGSYFRQAIPRGAVDHDQGPPLRFLGSAHASRAHCGASPQCSGIKVRDGEDAIASTRGACAPQPHPRRAMIQNKRRIFPALEAPIIISAQPVPAQADSSSAILTHNPPS